MRVLTYLNNSVCTGSSLAALALISIAGFTPSVQANEWDEAAQAMGQVSRIVKETNRARAEGRAPDINVQDIYNETREMRQQWDRNYEDQNQPGAWSYTGPNSGRPVTEEQARIQRELRTYNGYGSAESKQAHSAPYTSDPCARPLGNQQGYQRTASGCPPAPGEKGVAGFRNPDSKRQRARTRTQDPKDTSPPYRDANDDNRGNAQGPRDSISRARGQTGHYQCTKQGKKIADYGGGIFGTGPQYECLEGHFVK